MFNRLTTHFIINGFLFIMTVLAYLPLQFLQTFVLKPNLLLMSIFYFSIFTQTRPSLVFLILLGLFDDLLSNSLVGLTPLIYVLTSLFASSNQKALSEQRFSIVWASLALVVIVMSFLEALMLSVYYGLALFNTETVIVVSLSCLIYPSLHLCYSLMINWFRTHNA